MTITVEHPLVHESGVFFDCPPGEYHGALALSAHGIQSMHTSPQVWWANSPLNPLFKEPEPTYQMINGTAGHTRILEGKAAFERQYAPALKKEDYPQALITNEDLTLAIINAGGPKPRSGTRKAELSDLLLSFNPDAVIWEDLFQSYARQHAGKIFLPLDVISNIEIAAANIERHPELCRAFTGGMPEVSIFWTDEETGIPCKARLDYLKPKLIVDYKTFTNPYNRPIDAAIYRAMANYRYHVQAAWYLEAAAQIDPNRIFEGDNPIRDWVSEPKSFLFVFQMQGPAPVVRGKLFEGGLVMDAAREEIFQAKRQWVAYWKKFGLEQWLDVEGISSFDDSMFPAYMTTDY